MAMRLNEFGGIIPSYVEHGVLHMQLPLGIEVTHDFSDKIGDMTFMKEVTFPNSNIAFCFMNEDNYIFIGWFSGGMKVLKKVGKNQYRLVFGATFDMNTFITQHFVVTTHGLMKSERIYHRTSTNLYKLFMYELKDNRDYAIIDTIDRQEIYLVDISKELKMYADILYGTEFIPTFRRNEGYLERYDGDVNYRVQYCYIIKDNPGEFTHNL